MPTHTKHHIRSLSLEDINHGHMWFREPKQSLSCLPGLGSLSPSRARVVGADTSCLTPGLRLSSANGQSSPSVDSISITGTGGKVFSSAGTQTEVGGAFKQGNTCLILDYLLTVISQTYRHTHRHDCTQTNHHGNHDSKSISLLFLGPSLTRHVPMQSTLSSDRLKQEIMQSFVLPHHTTAPGRQQGKCCLPTVLTIMACWVFLPNPIRQTS